MDHMDATVGLKCWLRWKRQEDGSYKIDYSSLEVGILDMQKGHGSRGPNDTWAYPDIIFRGNLDDLVLAVAEGRIGHELFDLLMAAPVDTADYCERVNRYAEYKKMEDWTDVTFESIARPLFPTDELRELLVELESLDEEPTPEEM